MKQQSGLMKGLLAVEEMFDIRGGAILGMWSFTMIGLCIYSVVKEKPIDTQVAVIYGVVVTAYAYSRKRKDEK